MIKKSFLEGYATGDIRISTVLVCILCTTVLAAYIFLFYRMIRKNAFYNRSFNLSLMGMAVLTAAIILTIQSNIVVSLGMVGALSIVRFRTAIKDPMDLVFLFWAISIGIICGAGFAMIAVIASMGLTVIVLLFSAVPDARGNLLLVVNASSHKEEEAILKTVKEHCYRHKIRARNVTKTNLNLAIEVRLEDQAALIDQLMALEAVSSASLVEYEGDVTV